MPDLPPLASLRVVDRPEAYRFEIDLGDAIAEARYMRVGDTVIFTYTQVPEALEGQGLGSRLAAGALELVREQGLAVRTICPFMTHFVATHPEYADVRVR